MPSLRTENKPAEGRRLGFQPLSLPAFALKLRQALDADEDVMQMLEDVRAICALERHQAQEHDHRQTKPQSVPDEIVGLAKWRIGDDRMEVIRVPRPKEVASGLNVRVGALVRH